MTQEKPKYFIPTRDSFLEQKKNELLVSLYEKNQLFFEQIYSDILNYAGKNTKLSENTEKYFNQINQMIETLYPLTAENNTRVEYKYSSGLQKQVLSSLRPPGRPIAYVNFPAWERALGLNSAQKDLIYKTAMTFQLTSGCSNFCRRCNEWALPGVRSHFSYPAILEILDHMVQQKNDEISLFGASDPLDWEEDQKNISDVVHHLEKLPLEYSLLTKVPRGKENLLKKLLKMKANLSVSITLKNKPRIQKIEKETGYIISRQHDIEDLLIPARLDEDFVSIKPSITDGYGTEITLDGAFIIIPTFTSALHPFGHKKIKITSDTKFFPKKTTGRNALLVDYFKPIKGYNLRKKQICLDSLLDVQIESIILDNGTEELTPPGMRSLKEYLSIFEEKARLQREKMTPLVLRHLKQQCVSGSSLYLKKSRAHQKLCDRQGCRLSRLYAISFFLMSISDYAHKNQVKVTIMKFLLKQERIRIFKILSSRMDGSPLENLLNASDMDTFDLFRYCVFCLMNQENNGTIFKFMKAFPAAYDPAADIFVPLSQIQIKYQNF